MVWCLSLAASSGRRVASCEAGRPPGIFSSNMLEIGQPGAASSRQPHREARVIRPAIDGSSSNRGAEDGADRTRRNWNRRPQLRRERADVLPAEDDDEGSSATRARVQESRESSSREAGCRTAWRARGRRAGSRRRSGPKHSTDWRRNSNVSRPSRRKVEDEKVV